MSHPKHLHSVYISSSKKVLKLYSFKLFFYFFKLLNYLLILFTCEYFVNNLIT